ncbi:hypothetical protein SE924_10075 [Legionella pneumophila]|nr:hypothetical protein [Legionella pneumophila]
MKFIFVLFLCVFGTSALADPQSENDKKIIYCPEQVECKNSQCIGIGSNSEYFQRPVVNEFLQEGTYYFTGTWYNINNEPYGQHYIGCGYAMNYGPYRNNISLFMKNGSNFEPLFENWTKWQSGPSKIKACAADSSNMCPLTEKKDILFDPKFRQKNNKEEYQQYSSKFLIELRTEDGNLVNYSYTGDNLIPIDYEKTITACGVNTNCKIYTKIISVDNFGQPGPIVFLGTVTIYTGDILRIVSINNANEKLPINITTVYPMINTIVLYSK